MCFFEIGDGTGTVLKFDYDHPPRPPKPNALWHLGKIPFNKTYFHTVPKGRSDGPRLKVAGRGVDLQSTRSRRPVTILIQGQSRDTNYRPGPNVRCVRDHESTAGHSTQDSLIADQSDAAPTIGAVTSSRANHLR